LIQSTYPANNGKSKRKNRIPPKLRIRRPQDPGERYHERSGPIINSIKRERPGCHTADRYCACCMPYRAWRAAHSLTAPRSRDGEARWAIPGSRLVSLESLDQQADLSHSAQTDRLVTTGEMDESKQRRWCPEVRFGDEDLRPLICHQPVGVAIVGGRGRTLEGPCSGRVLPLQTCINSRPALIVSIVSS
jgi:hypothetical protein